MANVSLRDVTGEDLDLLFELQLDADSNRMAGFTPEDPGDRGAFDERWDRIFADEELTKKVVVADGEIVGSIFCHSWYGRPEVAYWIDRKHWGKGYATAALRALLHLVDGRPLFAMIGADNEGSKRVLEKCGFVIKSEGRSFAAARGEEIGEILYVLEPRPNDVAHLG